ncbi:MAG: ATP-dependent Clp protease ATP-binding subunit ClpC, partial [Evtepia sp.]|nr:ATP-dependent Clp protease ATP-binding subunit ClpC [Evtepia sp.]
LSQEENSLSARCLHSAGLHPTLLWEKLIDAVGIGVPNSLPFHCLTSRCKRIIERSTQESLTMHCPCINSAHLLLGLLRETDGLAIDFIRQSSHSTQELHEILVSSLQGDGSSFHAGKSRNDRDLSVPETKLLEQFSRDMVREALMGTYDPVIGRDQEICRTMQILIRRSKNNPVLLGDPGVGKTAVAEGLALRMAAGQVPEELQTKRLLSLDLSSMVAGTKYRGEFEDRVKTILREVRRAGNIILFLDEMHTIVGAGSAEGAIDAANIFKPALSRGEIQMIGATTLEEYRRYIEKDAALERRFQPVSIEEPSCDTALSILQRLKPRYEAHHHITITSEALEAAVTLSNRYIPDRRLPDKAIDLIDEAASLVRMGAMASTDRFKSLEDKVLQTFQDKEAAIRNQNFEKAAILRNAEADFRSELNRQRQGWKTEHASELVTEELVAKVLSQWTGIPVTSLTQKEREYLLHLEDVLHQRVSGQAKAVHAVSEAIRRGRSGLKDPRRPIGTFLFLGPTGVGKTELCKSLAEALFGKEDALLRFDMTEYSEAHSISRLLGSPPGYVGFDEGGQLTEQVRRRPYSVVLFDELEKAHTDIWSILLQIMDDGILTDAKGRKIDFRSTVLVLTSNVGADKIPSHGVRLGFANQKANGLPDFEQTRVSVLSELKKTFRPEFLNRLDEMIVFESLGYNEMKSIAEKMLGQISKRLEPLGIQLDFSDESLAYFAKQGFDPAYGARPLRRLLQTNVENPTAELLLSGTLAPGSVLSLTIQDGILSLERISA